MSKAEKSEWKKEQKAYYIMNAPQTSVSHDKSVRKEAWLRKKAKKGK